MASSYYDSTDKLVYDGDVAQADDLNDVNNAIDTAFELIEADFIDLGTQSEYWAGISNAWAEEPEDSEIEIGEYSALHHATKAAASAATAEAAAADVAEGVTDAQEWAEAPIGTGAPGTASASSKSWAESGENVQVVAGKYSAKHYSIKSDASATTSQNWADKAEKWAEEAENVQVETGQYSALHHKEKAIDAQLASEAAQTSAEAARDKAEQWAEEAEDVQVETGQYSALHHKEKALDAQLAAETARDKAQDWAEEAEDVPVEVGQYSSLHHAAKAAASAAEAAAIVNIGEISSHNMTGQSTITITADTDDVWDLYNIDTNFTITITGLTAGRTITIFMDDAVGHVTWPAGIYWAGGALPDLTAEIDCVVLTMLSSNRIIGSVALEHSVP